MVPILYIPNKQRVSQPANQFRSLTMNAPDLFDAHVALYTEVWNREAQESYFEEYDSWAAENPDALPSDYPVILAGGAVVVESAPAVVVESAPAVVVEAAPAVVLYSRVGADVQRLPFAVACRSDCRGLRWPVWAALREGPPDSNFPLFLSGFSCQFCRLN